MEFLVFNELISISMLSVLVPGVPKECMRLGFNSF